MINIKGLPLSILMLTCILVVSCSTSDQHKEEKEIALFDQLFNQKDFKSWWTYQYNVIDLSRDFIALNAEGKEVSLAEFFNQLITGKYVPVKVASAANETYWLHQLKLDASGKVRDKIIELSRQQLSDRKKYGKPFPKFSFTDLEGNTYTSESLRGKTVVIKTWFIGCGACIEEFPRLNDMVEDFKEQKDVVFISLALDEKEDLIAFLEKEPTNYKVIAKQGAFLTKTIKVPGYPTHIVIGQDGTYERFPKDSKSLITYLYGTKIPPPPPPIFIGE